MKLSLSVLCLSLTLGATPVVADETQVHDVTLMSGAATNVNGCEAETPICTTVYNAEKEDLMPTYAGNSIAWIDGRVLSLLTGGPGHMRIELGDPALAVIDLARTDDEVHLEFADEVNIYPGYATFTVRAMDKTGAVLGSVVIDNPWAQEKT